MLQEWPPGGKTSEQTVRAVARPGHGGRASERGKPRSGVGTDLACGGEGRPGSGNGRTHGKQLLEGVPGALSSTITFRDSHSDTAPIRVLLPALSPPPSPGQARRLLVVHTSNTDTVYSHNNHPGTDFTPA